MRTLAAKIEDDKKLRYAGDLSLGLDPTIPANAKVILTASGGAKAAKIVIGELFVQAKQPGGGWLPTARISAPIRVLMAMTTMGVLEMADDNEERETRALRFRLTERALDLAVANVEAGR